MGHVLAPTMKHAYATINFWGALANTETIDHFNWSEYVIECLLESVRRLKKDMMSNNPSTNLVGSHLFLQFFLLDNFDLGLFNKPHSVLPRISVFDQDSIWRRLTWLLITLVFSDSDFIHTLSIQKQFTGVSLKYDITSSQMLILPVPCPEGWMVVIWDMVTKTMNVLVPLYMKNSANHPNRGTRSGNSLEAPQCIVRMFQQILCWMPDKQKKAGVSSTNQSLMSLDILALHKCLKLRGNFSALAHNALWKVLALSNSVFDN